ncbi:hypothetical protein ACKI2N_032105 [Cupriavidus sp. 30B13]|uniref:hypothetical protein n=1 Tax=Cupriavidus sp. 30B13 TaxID=3384241 RepID=UPI003B91FF98
MPYRAIDNTDGLTGTFADNGLSSRTSVFDAGLGVVQTAGMVNGARAFANVVTAPVYGLDADGHGIGGSFQSVTVRANENAVDLATRFGEGVVNTAKDLFVQPVLQARDVALAAASVGYNELIRVENEPKWFPEMKSGVAEAYANGASQTRLLLQSNPLTGVGVQSYDATGALMEGRYGDVAQMAGGAATGFAVGAVAQKYGGYGLTIEDIGGPQYGPLAGQRGAVNLRLVTPESAHGTIAAETFTAEAPYVTRFDPRSPGRPDPQFSLDSLSFKEPAGYNAQGFPRDAGQFWGQWIEQNPGTISPGNKYLIENFDRLKVSPRIDQTWIDAFPEHGAYVGDVLVHHHVDFGRYTIPVPGRTHVGSGGIWHTK